MLRNFTTRAQPRARAVCSALTGKGRAVTGARRPMATVSVEGIPKVGNTSCRALGSRKGTVSGYGY